MKKQCQVLILSICVSMTGVTYAGMLEGLFTWLKNDKCTGLKGHWVGSGEVDKGSTVCYYKGDGTLSLQPSGDQFTLSNGTLTKQPGSNWLCPKQVPFNMAGSCEEGNIVVASDMYQLKGNMQDSTDADLQGTAVCNGYNLVVKSMHLQKA